MADLRLATDADSIAATIAAAQDRHPSAYARGRRDERAAVLDWLRDRLTILRTIADSDRTRNLADECAGILMALREGEHLKGE